MIAGAFQPIPNDYVGTIIAANIRQQRTRAGVIGYSGNKLPSGLLGRTRDAAISDYQQPLSYLGDTTIPMTAILQEAYEYQAEVTKHAVETGSKFADHIILHPVVFNVQFEVGNYDGLGANAKTAKNALDVAVEVWKSRQLFNLITTHRMLENMVCTSLQPVNEAPNWGRLVFQASFEQISLATIQKRPYPLYQVQGAPLAMQPGFDAATAAGCGLSAAGPAERSQSQLK